jgi:hypothetical protein
MSVMDERGFKVLLIRCEPDHIWDALARNYAGNDPKRWKRVAMIALHETAGWPLSYVGDLFGCNKGRVSRIIKQTKAELRALFGEDWQQHGT